jgi:hypothetical protein
MTPQSWKGAGLVFLALAVLLVVAALITGLAALSPGARPLIYPPITPTIPALAVFRSVILGAFAGVAFFTGLACFAWSAMVESRHQRTTLLDELTALRTQLSHPAPADKP